MHFDEESDEITRRDVLKGNLSASRLHQAALRIISEADLQQPHVDPSHCISTHPPDDGEAGSKRHSLHDPTTRQSAAGSKERGEVGAEDFRIIRSLGTR